MALPPDQYRCPPDNEIQAEAIQSSRTNSLSSLLELSSSVLQGAELVGQINETTDRIPNDLDESASAKQQFRNETSSINGLDGETSPGETGRKSSVQGQHEVPSFADGEGPTSTTEPELLPELLQAISSDREGIGAMIFPKFPHPPGAMNDDGPIPLRAHQFT